MKTNAASILSISVDRILIDEVLEKIKKGLVGKPQVLPIMSINPEIVMSALKDTALKEIINFSYLRLPDGIGIILAAKILGLPKLMRITGVALTKILAKQAAEWSVPIGLIGGKPGVALSAGKCLSEANLGLKWWGEEGPNIQIQNSEFRIQNENKQLLNYSITQFLSADGKQPYNFDQLIDRINQTNTQILFCAFGCPKQEYFIHHLKQYQSKLNKPLIAIAVGGAFDEIASIVSPAPLWIESIGLKWLWRLLHEPWRAKRQLQLFHFVCAIIRSRLIRRIK